jgi:uncharacterized Zn-finger protein
VAALEAANRELRCDNVQLIQHADRLRQRCSSSSSSAHDVAAALAHAAEAVALQRTVRQASLWLRCDGASRPHPQSPRVWAVG